MKREEGEGGEEGTFIGYDPGGNGKHGLALLDVAGGEVRRLTLKTCANAEQVLQEIEEVDVPLGLGVDTLTCWSTGPSGWRLADRWLLRRYPDVAPSVVAPNSLFGPMGVNGMAVLVSVRKRYPDLFVTEAHPKVLHHALFGERYDRVSTDAMDERLSSVLGVRLDTANDHEWDAAVSAFAALNGKRGTWTRDLHMLPVSTKERVVTPCGNTHYFWPE